MNTLRGLGYGIGPAGTTSRPFNFYLPIYYGVIGAHETIFLLVLFLNFIGIANSNEYPNR